MTRPYGRFFHIPSELAKLGNEVHVIVIGHSGEQPSQSKFNSVSWYSHDIRSKPASFLSDIIKLGKQINPDFVIGVSDAWIGYIASILAKKTKSKLVIDAYDDYESYMPWNLPLHYLWRNTIQNADLCTAAGPQLASLMDLNRKGKIQTKVLPMAADPEFHPMLKRESRIILNLPDHAPIIGYSGGWAINRGTDMLVDAFRLVRQSRPDAILALTGRPPEYFRSEPGVIILGYLPDSDMPTFINSLDVSLVITANTRFGRNSYPVKLYEAMACKVPVVATGTEPVRWALNDSFHHISTVGDCDAFAKKILRQLQEPEMDYPKIIHWPEIAAKFNELLELTLSYKSTSD